MEEGEKRYVGEEGEEVAHETGDEHQEGFLHQAGRVLGVRERRGDDVAEDADDRNHSQVQEDDDGGEKVPWNTVLRARHEEDEPTRVPNCTEGCNVQQCIEDLHAMVLIEQDHSERHQPDHNDNHKSIHNGLPYRIPCIVRLLLVDHVDTTIHEKEKNLRQPFFQRSGEARRTNNVHQNPTVQIHKHISRRQKHGQSHRNHDWRQVVHSVPQNECRICKEILLFLHHENTSLQDTGFDTSTCDSLISTV